jgi:glycosyltransferase involved in cell wall biosynthesis
MKIILDGSDAVVGTRAIRRYVVNLINEFSLSNQHDQFKIFVNYFRGNAAVIDHNIKDKKNFSKIHYPVPRHISLPLWEKLRFPPIDLFTGKADIFHALGDDCPPVRYATYIITLHGIAYMTLPDLITPTYVKLKQTWLRKMVRRADYFISVSENTKKEFLGFFPFIDPERVRVIPLGIGSEFRILRKEQVQKIIHQRFNLTRPYILYVGGIEPHKNIEGIIHAFSLLPKIYEDLDLVLVGHVKGQPSHFLELIQRLNLKNRIKFIEYVSQESDDLPFLYNGAKCFIFPSFSEGWTSPPLEAMACGTPVVTSNVSSLPETVGNAALMVDPRNYEEIANTLAKVLSDTALNNTMEKRGLAQVSKFTWKRCAEKTYAFYKYIIESTQ